jgi:hypothetical protein
MGRLVLKRLPTEDLRRRVVAETKIIQRMAPEVLSLLDQPGQQLAPPSRPLTCSNTSPAASNLCVIFRRVGPPRAGRRH